MSDQVLRIATRASRLALWQAHHTAELLRAAAPERDVEIVRVSTVGDRHQSEPLHRLGGFGIFTREVQLALLDGRADVAVHSLKDLPTDPVDGLALAAVPSRGSPFDALVLPAKSAAAAEIDALTPNARVGTGSLRRRAQLLHRRSDLQFHDVRGNVETRLKKLDTGEYDALVLAEAGLRRLGMENRISTLLQPPVLFPAVGQGALGIECRADDAEALSLLARLTDADTYAAVVAERSVLSTLNAGCHAPLGVSTTMKDGQVTLEAVVLSADGRQRISAAATEAADQAVALGRKVADELRRQGADELVAAGHTDH